MNTTTPIACKYCGQPNDTRCSRAADLERLTDLPAQIQGLMRALQAGYYVIDGREPLTQPARPSG